MSLTEDSAQVIADALVRDRDRVPLAPFQEAFARSGRSLRDVAEDLGWLVAGRPDERRIARALGLAPMQGSRRADGSRPWMTAESVAYDRAVLLARAIGVDPVDVGV